MQPLLEDPHHFRREAFGYSRELFNRSPRNGQQLRITRADAGLLAERIAETNPDGFCFARGLGAFVPSASTVAAGDADSMAVTTEYASRVLRVGTVAIGGRRNAGLLAVQILGASDLRRRKHMLNFKARLVAESRAKNLRMKAEASACEEA